MDMPATMTGHPALDGRVFVCSIVVENCMDVEVFGNLLFNLLQECQKLLVPVAVLALRNDRTVCNIQPSKQCGHPVSNVIMGDSFNISQSHRQHGRRTIQCLKLCLFVNSQNHGILGRAQVQADNVPDFLNKERVSGEFKALLPVRLKAKGSPNPMHGRLGNPRRLRQRAHRPVRTLFGLGLERFSNNSGHFFRFARAAKRMFRARCTRPCGMLREAARTSKSLRTSSVKVKIFFGRPVFMTRSPQSKG